MSPTRGKSRTPSTFSQGCGGQHTVREESPVTADLFVYFFCEELPVESNPTALPRRVAESSSALRTALEQLLLGPTDEEAAAGFYGPFPRNSRDLLIGTAMQDGTAFIDFSRKLQEVPNISASAASGQVQRALAFTVFQFPSVDAVTYRLEGDAQAWCALFEIVCGEPSLTRSQWEEARRG